MLKNKKGIIFGIANDHSIAWGISKKLSEHGAELALTYQNDTLLKRIEPLSKEINSKLLIKDKIVSQIKLKIDTYKNKELPDDLKKIQPTKPGSRNL